MVAEFGAFATRMTTPLTGLAQLLTGDRESSATLVHTALTRAYTERKPTERRAVTTLVRTWLAGAPPVGESAELSYDLELLRRSLDALSEHQRVAVVLHHWSDLPVADIAAVLRRPERAVAADLAAGVAELHVPAPAGPDEPPPTVAARLAALVAAAGPPFVDLAHVAQAGQAQRRHRRRTAVVAAAVLVVAGTTAALLTGGEPEPATSDRTPVRVVDRYDGPAPVVDDRARRLTAQLTTALDDVLPAIPGPQAGVVLPPTEFSLAVTEGPDIIYAAHTNFSRTSLFFLVESRAADAFVPCAEPDQDCRYRQFPDNTVAEVVVGTETSPATLVLTSRRPDGTALVVFAEVMGQPGTPELSVEDMFRFATVLTY